MELIFAECHHWGVLPHCAGGAGGGGSWGWVCCHLTAKQLARCEFPSSCTLSSHHLPLNVLLIYLGSVLFSSHYFMWHSVLLFKQHGTSCSFTVTWLWRKCIFAFKDVTIGRLARVLLSTGIMQGSGELQIVFVSCWGGAEGIAQICLLLLTVFCRCAGNCTEHMPWTNCIQWFPATFNAWVQRTIKVCVLFSVMLLPVYNRVFKFSFCHSTPT